jgi:hypothetical protein
MSDCPHSQDKDNPWNMKKKKINLPATSRPSQSVTEIPGAAALPVRLHQQGSFKPMHATKAIKQGAMARANYTIEKPEFSPDSAAAQSSTFPAIMWFLIGLICPPFLLCEASASAFRLVFFRLSSLAFLHLSSPFFTYLACT